MRREFQNSIAPALLSIEIHKNEKIENNKGEVEKKRDIKTLSFYLPHSQAEAQLSDHSI